MANINYTFDNIIATGSGYFQKESGLAASESVRRMQTKLNRCGYSTGTPDGKFGTNTYNAVCNFQTAYSLGTDGKAGKKTLAKLDELSPDSTTEHYGRELTKSELTSSYSTITTLEAIARILYNEWTTTSDGQNAVAKEIYNRLHSARVKGFLDSGKSANYKNILYASGQYFLASGAPLYGGCAPNIYSDSWNHCVSIATSMSSRSTYVPYSTLGKQCYHVGVDSSYPSSAKTSTRVQIPTSTGNKFYDTMDNPN